MSLSQLRQDPVTGNYVIISEGRSNRPNGSVKACFFCPGNEGLTPPEYWAYRQGNNWWVRGFPNAFPVFEHLEGLEAAVEQANGNGVNGFYHSKPGHGRHYVIVDTPRHDEEIHQRSDGQIRELLWYIKEMIAAQRDGTSVRYVLAFKNKGKEAGASLEHPHTQLIVSPAPLPKLTEEIAGAARYFMGINPKNVKDQCVYCDMKDYELWVKDKHGIKSEHNRVLAERDFFVAFAPFASASPYEVMIMPKIHQAHYDSLDDPQATQLSEIVREIFRKMNALMPDFPYNLGLHTAPLGTDLDRLFHWHIELKPVKKTDAGIEKFGGLGVNTMSPEKFAFELNSSQQP